MVSLCYRDATGQQHVVMPRTSSYTSVLSLNPSVAIIIHLFHIFQILAAIFPLLPLDTMRGSECDGTRVKAILCCNV